MSFRVQEWRTRDGEKGWLHPPLPDPMLALLGPLAGGVWSVELASEEEIYPYPPNTPARVTRSVWRLLRDGQESGTVAGELEEGGLNMAWSTFSIRLVEARLADGRALRLVEQRRRHLLLSAEGFSEDAVQRAAEEVGLEIQA